MRILPIHAGANSSLDDCLIWGHSSNGDFTMKSAFDLKMKEANRERNWSWQYIWKLDIPPKIRTFFMATGSWKVTD